MEEKDLFWNGFNKYIQNLLSQETYQNWIANTYAIRIDNQNNTISIAVPNNLSKQFWEKQLIGYVLTYSLDHFGTEYIPSFVVAPNDTPTNDVERETRVQASSSSDHAVSSTYHHPQLNPKYTFENFVIGEDNELAASAALTVTDQPGVAYNPLLIYGGVGLGKTHLMQAIGHQMLAMNPDTKVVYVTSETFVNDFVNSLQFDKQNEFREKYRTADILLVDDIQFLANKESTQKEFFNVFNALHNQGKQIVVTSDRLPNDIDNLEDRLISRFKWGLSTDITPPDLETRIAILRKKASSDNLDISSAALTYIANNIDTNIRELEGALMRVLAYATMTGEEITQDLAAKALESLIGKNADVPITVHRIIQVVGQHFSVSEEAIKGRKRNREIVIPRQIAMYLSRQMTEMSFPKIGEQFGNKNHTTVIHAYEKIQESMQEDPQLKSEVNALEKKIKK